jgi:hypothetical protein
MIASAVGLIAVTVCYPIYLIARAIKAPLNLWQRRNGKTQARCPAVLTNIR